MTIIYCRKCEKVEKAYGWGMIPSIECENCFRSMRGDGELTCRVCRVTYIVPAEECVDCEPVIQFDTRELKIKDISSKKPSSVIYDMSGVGAWPRTFTSASNTTGVFNVQIK